MPRKSSPFEPVEWPEVVEQGFAFATKAAGFPFGMLILGFPGETEDDINETIALFDRLRNYRSILIPFAFEATGMLDQENSFRIRNTKRLHLELVKKIFSHNVF